MGSQVRSIILLGLAAAGIALAQGDAVQQVVLWERAKDSAAVRRARAAKQAEAKGGTAAKPVEGTADEAVRWERAKDGAAKRQAQKDANAPSSQTATTKKK